MEIAMAGFNSAIAAASASQPAAGIFAVAQSGLHGLRGRAMELPFCPRFVTLSEAGYRQRFSGRFSPSCV
jgi:hypothetical protein